MRSLTIQEAAASTNIWFKVESEEQQRMFQEEFFRQGGKWLCGDQELRQFPVEMTYCLTEDDLSCIEASSMFEPDAEQVQIIWQEEPSITIDSLAPEVTLSATLNPNVPYDDFIRLLQQIEHETLVKDFISDKCLRKLPDSQLASLARFFVEKAGHPPEEPNTLYVTEGIKAFVLTAKAYHTRRTEKNTYMYKFYRQNIESSIKGAQVGLYQAELKNSPEWEGLSWGRRGEE